MKPILFFTALLFLNTAFGQTVIESKQFGKLEFFLIKYGVAQVVSGTVDAMENTPTGTHGWLKEFEITKITDSVPATLLANFGVQYVVKAKDTVEIEVEIEWIFPEKMINDQGKKFKSTKYKTQRPTNIESASSYSLDKPFELLKGKWTLNIYLENRIVNTKTFVLY